MSDSLGRPQMEAKQGARVKSALRQEARYSVIFGPNDLPNPNSLIDLGLFFIMGCTCKCCPTGIPMPMVKVGQCARFLANMAFEIWVSCGYIAAISAQEKSDVSLYVGPFL